MYWLLLCILFVCNVISVTSIDVETTLGPIRGKLVHDELAGVSYNSFQGIPYAEPPVGDLRFKPPVRKQPWTTVSDATKPGRVCPQTELFYSRQQMDEDCLIFNVYTPANSSSELLPVIFHIHGGGFSSQSGNDKPIYGPQFYVRSDLIVVTLNYRLGALGFLSLCTEEVSGNAGLKDVLLALKIVYENISRFGGDPNNITIRGNGAGSAIASLLMLTNESRGLFQRVMLISGTFLNSKYIQLYPRENAISLARELDLDSSNQDSLIQKLKNVDAFDIVEAQEAISRRDPKRGFQDFKPFKPTVELEYDSAVLTRPLVKLINEGEIYDVPMLIGFNNQEGLEMFPLLKNEPELIDKLNENFEQVVPKEIKYPEGSAERRDLASRIRDFYFGGGNITFVDVQNYINLITDTQHSYGIDTFIRLFKEKKTAPVYYYVFTGDTELNWFKAFYNITYPGGSHFDGLGYIFMTTITKARYRNLDPNTKRTQDAFLQNMRYFAYNGIPLNSPSWPETGQERNHVVLSNSGSYPVYHRPIPERIGFWSSVYQEYIASAPDAGPYFCMNGVVSSVV